MKKIILLLNTILCVSHVSAAESVKDFPYFMHKPTELQVIEVMNHPLCVALIDKTKDENEYGDKVINREKLENFRKLAVLKDAGEHIDWIDQSMAAFFEDNKAMAIYNCATIYLDFVRLVENHEILVPTLIAKESL
ncbi:MAG: hypothetical protein WC707_05555 [Candidatus Babeliaceae bacterium]|jgi:hypothetical protein